MALTPQRTWVRVPSTLASDRAAALVDFPPPMLMKGTRWQEECATGAANGIVLPCWW
jgi:hypothetical protein